MTKREYRFQAMKEIVDWDIADIPSPVVSKYPRCLEAFPSVISSMEDFLELQEAIALYRSSKHKVFFFRGHQDKNFRLVSTIGRMNSVDYSSEYEVFKELRKICDAEGYNRYRMESFNEELFYYGIGRHLGLTCRLLDWTMGLWQALAFALDGYDDKDAALWVMMLDKALPRENRSPFSIEDNRIHILKEDYYRPDENSDFPLGIKRRSRQYGYFSVVKESWISFPLNEIPSETSCDFFCYIIPRELKNSLRQDEHIIDVEKWLYIEKEAQIIEKIKGINRIITKGSVSEYKDF